MRRIWIQKWELITPVRQHTPDGFTAHRTLSDLRRYVERERAEARAQEETEPYFATLDEPFETEVTEDSYLAQSLQGYEGRHDYGVTFYEGEIPLPEPAGPQEIIGDDNLRYYTNSHGVRVLLVVMHLEEGSQEFRVYDPETLEMLKFGYSTIYRRNAEVFVLAQDAAEEVLS